MALVFEAFGALCFFALVVLLAWAAVAKLRPDLDEEGFDLAGERSGDAPSIEPAIIEEPSWSPPTRPVKQSRSVRSEGVRARSTPAILA